MTAGKIAQGELPDVDNRTRFRMKSDGVRADWSEALGPTGKRPFPGHAERHAYRSAGQCEAVTCAELYNAAAPRIDS